MKNIFRSIFLINKLASSKYLEYNKSSESKNLTKPSFALFVA